MKLLLVQESDWFKRGPHQQHHLADRLSIKGHQIRVIDYELDWQSQKQRGFYSRRQVFKNVHKINEQANVVVIRPGMLRIPFLHYLSLLRNHKKEIEYQIKEFSPDVIVGYGIINSYLAAVASQASHIPFVYYWIDVLHRLIPFKLFQPLGKMVEHSALIRATRILVINGKLKDYLVNLGAPKELIHVVPAGIDIEKYNPAINSDLIRQQYKIDKEDIVLFFMGWLYNFSGLKEVALEMAKIKNNHIKLLVLGEGDAFNELLQIREKLNLQDKIILSGKRPYQEVPAFIAAANYCLLPAYPEEKIMQDIVPIKMYEYMAMSKPVISTKLPGVLKEFGESNGVTYVDRPEDVITKVFELMESGGSQELGSKARKFVEKLSWDNITDEFERILDDVINEEKDRWMEYETIT